MRPEPVGPNAAGWMFGSPTGLAEVIRDATQSLEPFRAWVDAPAEIAEVNRRLALAEAVMRDG